MVERVQLPVYTDAWMQGDRYGTVQRVTKLRKNFPPNASVSADARGTWNDAEIGSDYLGGSIYANPRDFFREHIGIAAKSRADGCNYGCYFPDMVHTAIEQARKTLANPPKIRKES